MINDRAYQIQLQNAIEASKTKRSNAKNIYIWRASRILRILSAVDLKRPLDDATDRESRECDNSPSSIGGDADDGPGFYCRPTTSITDPRR